MPRGLLAAIAAVAGFAAGGCSDPETIATYKVPKTAPVPDAVKSTVVEFRLYGAIVPVAENQSYFVLMQGKASDLTPHIEALDALIKGLVIPKELEKNPTWTLPKDWAEDRSNKNRVATFYPNGKDKGLEVTLTRFGGDVAGNVNRWRKKVGLAEVDPDELGTAVKMFKVQSGQTGYLVDAKGKKDPTQGGMPGMMMPRAGGL